MHARLGLIVGGVALCSLTQVAAARPFTVADGISMVRVNTGTYWFDSPVNPRPFHSAPDGRTVLVVIRTGDVVTGEHEFKLLKFDTAAIREFLKASGPAGEAMTPAAETLATFRTKGYAYGIDSINWTPDSRTVLFVGRGRDRIGQVFSLDVERRTLSQLTQHAEDIGYISVSGDGHTLLFWAQAPPEDWTERNARGYALTAQHRYDTLYITDPKEIWRDYRQYLLDIDTKRTVALDTPRSWLPQDTWPSPGGRWAVTQAVLQESYPAHWSAYAFIEAERAKRGRQDDEAGNPADRGPESGADDAPIFVNQFFLVDLKTGATRPLLDAPIGDSSPTATVTWSADDERVLVAPTYLPLAGADKTELEHRRRVPAVAEVLVSSGRVRRVTNLTDWLVTGEPASVVRLERLADGSVVVQRRVGWPGRTLPAQRVRLVGDTWGVDPRKIPERRTTREVDVEFLLVQDLNTLPEIGARDRRSGKMRILTDLNPELRDVTFGHVELFRWRDRLSRDHIGGLVRPPGYEAGKRYPVVIQTYGFHSDNFLLDGPPLRGRAVFAAQALASKGMFVLQMPREEVSAQVGPEGPYEDTGEMPRFNAMLEAAIDALDARGLVDRDRVGLTGFSRSTTQVFGTLTFSKYPIAASVVGDGSAITPYGYVADYAAGSFMATSEREIGAPPWGDGMKLWLERSPAFHYDRIRTPLRLEMYGRWADARWDTYVMLKRFRRPVELIHIPDGIHILTAPHGVHTSQQGSVDWYAFWLKGEEDPNPAKAEQYVRWRKLRLQHESSLAASRDSDDRK